MQALADIISFFLALYGGLCLCVEFENWADRRRKKRRALTAALREDKQ